MGKPQQSVADRQDRILGILRHSGPATVGHLASILRVSTTTVAKDMTELRVDGEVIALPGRIRGALVYAIVEPSL